MEKTQEDFLFLYCFEINISSIFFSFEQITTIFTSIDVQLNIGRSGYKISLIIPTLSHPACLDGYCSIQTTLYVV